MENIIDDSDLIDEDPPQEFEPYDSDYTKSYTVEETINEGVSERVEYFKHGTRILHRIGGPAIKSEHLEEWYCDGKLHREDGPAKTTSYSGEVQHTYAINGIILTKEEFETKIKPEIEVEFIEAVEKCKKEFTPIYEELLELSKQERDLIRKINSKKDDLRNLSEETGIPISGEFGFDKCKYQPRSRVKFKGVEREIMRARLEERGVAPDWYGFAMLEMIDFSENKSGWSESSTCK